MKNVLRWGIRGTLARGEVFGGRIFWKVVDARKRFLWACLGLALVLGTGGVQAEEITNLKKEKRSSLALGYLSFEKNIKPEYRKLGSSGIELPEKKDDRQIFYEGLLLDYPLGEMSKELAQLPEDTAAYVIAIAKKESQWGRHAPSKNGQDCFNYWGYKGASEEQIMGYSCFSSRAEAVEKVGTRIQKLLDKGLDTPEKFIVWKCGSSCAGHDPQGVAKWIADVKSVLKSLKS